MADGKDKQEVTNPYGTYAGIARSTTPMFTSNYLGSFKPPPDLNPWPTVPDYCEPLMGWRAWAVNDGNIYGLGVGRNQLWAPRQQASAVHLDRQFHAYISDGSEIEVPCQSPCSTCGLYAYKSDSWAKEQIGLGQHYGSYGGIPTVIGTVALWGRIVEHEHGYRAQYAYPTKFVYAIGCDGAALATTYGIPYEEDETWKSVHPSEESLANHSGFPYQPSSQPAIHLQNGSRIQFSFQVPRPTYLSTPSLLAKMRRAFYGSNSPYTSPIDPSSSGAGGGSHPPAEQGEGDS